jgi:hypothetical protein
MRPAVVAGEDQWASWSDAALLEYEEQLYDLEVAGDDVWSMRDAVLWEINRRGLTRTGGLSAK